MYLPDLAYLLSLAYLPDLAYLLNLAYLPDLADTDLAGHLPVATSRRRENPNIGLAMSLPTRLCATPYRRALP
jgi:hypothetical protein